MKHARDATRHDNPFSSSRVRPGAIPYAFPGGESTQQLVERLRDAGWRGQILGRHGSGKSTLLAALIPAIEATGRNVFPVTLRDGQRRLPAEFLPAAAAKSNSIVVIDGYEQLGRWSRFRLARFCRKHRLGLLVTSHAPVGLPEVYCTRTTVDLARRIVEQLLHEGDRAILTPVDVEKRFHQCGGDLRETLFSLYDDYDERKRGGKG